jgi:Ubiquitin-conjugating enzyme
MSRSSRAVAFRRLGLEYKSLLNDCPEGIIAGPKDEDNYFIWTAMFSGPEGTPFEGGVFEAVLIFPDDYPLKPPEMKFVDKIWHPNGKFLALSACFANRISSIPRWQGLHIYSASTRRRPKPIRACIGEMVTNPECRKDPDIGHELTGRAKR